MGMRRQFLQAATAASISALTLGSPEADAQSSQGAELVKTASFGWEVDPLDWNGANVSFEVQNDIVMIGIDIDFAFTIKTLPAAPGFAEVLAHGMVSRGGPPIFEDSPAAYITELPSGDFGTIALSNPNNLNIHSNPNLSRDAFYSVITKVWVPGDGSGGASYRHVSAEMQLSVNSGDFIAFHMDHAGVPVDAEMQVVLRYTEG